MAPRDAESTRPETAAAAVREGGPAEQVFLVPGMHCAGCIAKIERELGRLPGIDEVRANLSLKRVRIRYRPERWDAAALKDRLAALGFTASLFDAAAAGEEDRKSTRELLLAMAVAGFAAANIMLLSISVWAGLFDDMEPWTRALMHWFSALIALPAVAYAGRPFYRSAWAALKKRQMNMDVPISLAVLLATGASLAQTVRGGVHVYFDAAVTLLFFLLIGRTLDQRMRARASRAARDLLALQQVEAILLHPDGREERVPAAQLKPGLVVRVQPGMRVPADGVVRTGRSEVDAGLITGESVPEPVAPGSRVYAGMLNLSGPIEVEVSAARENTLIAEIAALMEAAEQSRSRFVRLADRIARIYAPGVHLLAAGTFLGWWLVGGIGWYGAMMNAVAVLIITCPCALGLAVPVVQVVASGALFRRGILLKSGDALERLATVDTVVLDKTGTLSEGRPQLANAHEVAAADLALAAALARHSGHPLARALVEAAGAGGPAVRLQDVREEPGMGLEAVAGGRRLRLGRLEWILPELGALRSRPPTAKADGPELWMLWEGHEPVRFAFRDRLRADAGETVAALKARGLHVVMLSGDRPVVAEAVAARLGIADWRGGLKPQEKIAAITKLKEEGRRVLMVGDGLNDAPALKAADVSMSPAEAADITHAAADLVFQGARLEPVVEAIDVARAARRRVLENFGLAFAYNAVAVPLAVAGFVTPLIAAVAMSSSSLTVTLNALRLRLAGVRATADRHRPQAQPSPVPPAA
ncbi:MAG: heavy metal translocating P-type ATPase [Alphaproteobacteria bacterium]|nr:MAG: heavy metal translocating P-type ATPase [Alphaproteobacteria bacterium]